MANLVLPPGFRKRVTDINKVFEEANQLVISYILTKGINKFTSKAALEIEGVIIRHLKNNGIGFPFLYNGKIVTCIDVLPNDKGGLNICFQEEIIPEKPKEKGKTTEKVY